MKRVRLSVQTVLKYVSNNLIDTLQGCTRFGAAGTAPNLVLSLASKFRI